MTEDAELHRELSEHNRQACERLAADYEDLADWKINALFYPAPHRASHWLAMRTGPDPKNHAERNRRVRRELRQAFADYRDHYRESIRARYRDGFRVTDERQRAAYVLLCRVEEKLPFQ